MPAVIHPKTVSSEKRRSVGFMNDPVESFSRPVNNTESWALYNFEMHARKCAYCHDPYEVHRKHQQLCEHGHRLAQEVASYIYTKEGKTFSMKEEDNKIVQIEIPAGHVEVSGLLRAIERSFRHRSRHPFVSMDRSYHVAPRTPTTLPVRQKSVKVEHEKPKTKSSRPRSGEVVDWPDKVEINNFSSHRGSLYDEDLARKRRSAKYNVEVREPSARDLREHRLSGYYR
ncbi:uncharacterized protein M421DRAFT_426264 [Didymella exigua CBS 183.55]|uniref:Uncharacterized protein n=1 Tax=Didymella exigua CBS 183.55 TaxID=1150837 RepID=A0A6A5R4J6_9PLEO|nr:uncharacterized protein M421DRAFT_426264 [Didymella exigua CBS 183.55]KAF1923025.1 hypothetical protein M421DRAFT_426264 [Didymella exigua CBS 183.55]